MKKIHLLLFCLVTIMQAEASHLAGGDIEYKNIGFRRWEIKLVLYRDCNGIPMPGCTGVGVNNCTKTLSVKPMTSLANGGLNPNGCSAPVPSISVTVTSYLVQDARKIRQDICGQSAKNICDNRGTSTPGSFNPSLEAYYYKGILDMSSPVYNNACPYWEVAWEECCRNSGTENILNPGGVNFFISGVINIFYNQSNVTFKNNSPQLLNEPIDVVCSSQEVIYNMGAVDPDRDSLTYAIGKSRGAGGAAVTYNSPYSAIYPFPLSSTSPPHINFPQPNGPYVILDSLTGDIAFNGLNNSPTLLTYGCINMEITQWAYDVNGTPYIVGRTQRDLQIFVRSCTSNNIPKFATSPALSGGNPKYNWSLCAGDQICFTITAKDIDDGPGPEISTKLDTTSIKWNGSISRPGKLTFVPDYDTAIKSQRPREDRWKFCWQTEKSDGSTQPYSFTVSALDNNCPNIGISIKAFNIYVNPSVTANAGIDTAACPGDTVKLVGKGGQKYKWERIQGSSLVTMVPYGTVDSLKVGILSTSPAGAFNDYVLTSYVSYPNASSSSNECKNTDTIRVSTRTYPILTRPAMRDICRSLDTLILPNFTITPSSQSQANGGSGVWSYIAKQLAISASNGLPSLLVDSLASLPPDTFFANIANNTGNARINWLRYSYKGPASTGGCVRTDSAAVRVFAQPKIDAGATVQRCIDGGIYPLNASGGHVHSPRDATGRSGVWSMIQGGGLVSTTVGLNTIFTYDPQLSGVSLIPQFNLLGYAYTIGYNSNSLQCTSTDTFRINIIKPPVVNAGADVTICKNEPTFLISAKSGATTTSTIPSSSYWSLAAGQSPNISNAIIGGQSFQSQNGSVPDAGGNWKLYYNDTSSGCVSRDSMELTVKQLPKVSLTSLKDSLCKTETSLQLTGTVSPTSTTGIGVYAGPGINTNTGLVNIQSPSVAPNNSYVFSYRFTDVFGCADSAQKTIFVLGTPTSLAITGNTNPIKNTSQNYTVPLVPYQSYVWSANKGVVQSSSLNTASVLWTDTGAAWVKVVTANICGTATSEQNVQVAPTVGLNEVNGLSNVTLYPNPTFGEVFIEGNSAQQQVQLEVFNSTLQLVYTQTILTEQGKINTSFNTGNLSEGLYFVKIGNGNKFGVYKLVVIR